MRRVRTRVHRGPVITSLHGGHIWMYRLYWHCNSVALVRAHCVYAGFGSPSAAGGSAPSSKKPRQEGSATAPLERSRQRGARSWPTLASPPHQGRALGDASPLLQILVSALSARVFMWIKAEKAQRQQGRRQDGVQSLRVSLCSSIWK